MGALRIFLITLAAVFAGDSVDSDAQCTSASGKKCRAHTGAISLKEQREFVRLHQNQLTVAAEQEQRWKGFPEMQQLQSQVMNTLKYNVLMSNALPLNRSVPDVRSKVCQKKAYPELVRGATVVLPFYKEATSVLLRTAQSILDRTPVHLLAEVLLIDDGSDAPWSKEVRKEAKNFAAGNPQVQLVHRKKHLGLMSAKMEGARRATGEVLIFLDSHCEVNHGWIEPLLASIAENEHAVPVPIIDSIDAQNFQYYPGSANRGVLSPGLYFAGRCCFNETEQKRLDAGHPVPLPAMPGGLFAISKKYFEEIGGYDEGLRIWGAENTELSFKVWRCLNGRVELQPCSHVGHIFKDVPHSYPEGSSLHLNYRRVADVWLDDYRDIYFKAFPLASVLKPGNVSLQRSIRSNLDCKSWRWYTMHVDPGFFVPQNSLADGLLISKANDAVLSVPYGRALASNAFQEPHVLPAISGPRSHMSDYNYWFVMSSGRVVHLGIWIEECLGAKKSGSKWSVVVCQCAITEAGSGCTDDEIEWDLLRAGDSSAGIQLRHRDAHKCLSIEKTKSREGTLRLEKCKTERTRWRFEQHPSLPDHSPEDDEDDELADAHNRKVMRQRAGWM